MSSLFIHEVYDYIYYKQQEKLTWSKRTIWIYNIFNPYHYIESTFLCIDKYSISKIEKPLGED